MFSTKVKAKYKIVAHDEMLDKLIEDASKELETAEQALLKAQDEIKKLLDTDEEVPVAKLQQMEKNLTTLDNEFSDALENYQKALHTTIEDLKSEHRYTTWKDER